MTNKTFGTTGSLREGGKACIAEAMPTDEQLVRDARAGNEGAAEQLFRRYQDRIYGYLLRLTRNRELAADATQEAFIRGFRGLGAYKERNLFKSWLFRIAHNEGMRILGRRGPVFEGEAAQRTLESVPDSAPGPHEAYVQQDLVRILRQGVDTLPEEMRVVMHLRLSEDMPFREIADVTDTPLNTVLGRMHSARKKLKAFMDREG